MRVFCELYDQLDRARGTRDRVAALVNYFQTVPAADGAWALRCLLGKQRKRLITGRRLREICLEGTNLPEWLFEDCYSHVGDTAETIALLWRGADAGADAGAEAAGDPLHHWMEHSLPAVAALEGEAQAEAVRALWSGLPARELLVFNKLLTGGFRVGVAQGLVVRALARVSGLEEPMLTHRLMGGFQPSAAAFEALLAPGEGGESALSRPYPFFLASPLEPERLQHSSPHDWWVEWKWDGIRGQLIHRKGETFLWSRGEELINGSFPELIDRARALPDGTALDGEVIVWPQGADRPRPFADLQRRLGRIAPGVALLRECPADFVAYDLLEANGLDLRPEPLYRRREQLMALADHLEGQLRVSPLLPLPGWDDLDTLREKARAAGAEGLMLKARASPYLVGRRRGHWWKHKLDPLRLDAVLLYAQAGSGRRANLFTDYTFALWTTASEAEETPRLVTFAKAYSGLDDAEIQELDRWIRRHTIERFGPVRSVQPVQVFELAFEGLQRSRRHKSGIAVRFPRISRWRRDKPAQEADTLASALQLMDPGGSRMDQGDPQSS